MLFETPGESGEAPIELKMNPKTCPEVPLAEGVHAAIRLTPYTGLAPSGYRHWWIARGLVRVSPGTIGPWSGAQKGPNLLIAA